MSYDSMPEYEVPPTFEEVVRYATEAGLFGKVSISKFYDYYAKQGFLYRGQIMNWKGKLKEWADRQTSTPVITEREYAAQKKTKKPEKSFVVADLWKAVESI